MPEQKYNVGDRVCSGEYCGEVVAILTPKSLPNSDEAMPQYRVRLDDGQDIEVYQNGLRPES